MSPDRERISDDAQRMLALHEGVYRSIFDSLKEGMSVIRLLYDSGGKANDLVFLAVNHAHEVHSGKPAKESVGRRGSEVMANVEPIWFERYQEVVRTQKAARFDEYDAYLERWFRMNVSPLPEKDTVLVVFEDITERKRAEEARRESEEKYRSLFENMTEMAQVLEPIFDEESKPVDFRYIEVNKATEMLTGKKREEMDGKKATELWGFVEDHWLEMLEGVLKTGRPARMVDHNKAVDLFYDVFAWKVGDAKVAIVSSNITEAKRAQRKAEEERVRLQAILDNTPVAIGITDAEGGIVLENGVLARIWSGRLELNSVADYSKCRAWWPETSKPVEPEEWPSARALKGESSSETFDIDKFDGTKGALIVSATPMHDDAGNIIGSVWTVQDISEIRRLELELKRSNAELQQFAYVASHDLQEPLRMVTSYLWLLDKRYGEGLGPEAREFMGYAVSGSHRMKQLIDDLLQYSRINSRKVDLASVDMNEVARRVVDDLHVAAHEANAEIIIGELPTVRADRSRMTQVLQNLLSNAVKFRGPSPSRVEVSAHRRGNDWVFAVRDNGIGIDPKYHENLFKMFQRLHVQEEYPGTGVGLAIAKKIVEQHGGRIWLESRRGEGSTFFFSIPERSG